MKRIPGLSQLRVQVTGLDEPFASPIQAGCSAGINEKPQLVRLGFAFKRGPFQLSRSDLFPMFRLGLFPNWAF